MPQNEGVKYFASQPGQSFTMRFLEDGAVCLQPGYLGSDWKGTLSLAGSLDASPQKTSNARVEVRHSASLVEWYENKQEGLEHGFVVQDRSADMDTADGLQLKMEVEGLRVKAESVDSDNLILTDETGVAVLGYQHLKVWDANGAAVPASMHPSDAGILLAVNDAAARYPLTIDPLIVNLEHNQKLSPEGEVFVGYDPDDDFAQSVAVAGNIAAIGAPSELINSIGGRAGSVYIFQRVESRWSLMQKLIPDQVCNFGTSVALSGDSFGSALIVGAPGYQSSRGRAMVYRLLSEGWTQEAVLFPTDSSSLSYSSSYPLQFGESVAIDGDSVLVGAPLYHQEKGGAYVFSKTGGVWVQDHVAIGVYADGHFGSAVALSENHVVIGSPDSYISKYINGNWYNYPNSGSVHVYRRVDGNLVSTPSVEGAYTFQQLGQSVAISGTTAVVGCGANSGDRAYVYSLSISGGVSGVSQLVDDDAGTNLFGCSVAVDGDTIVIGARAGNASGVNGAGCAYVFTYNGSNWIKEQVVHSANAEFTDQFGYAVAISGDTLLAGSPYNGSTPSSAKGVDIFTRSAGAWTLEQNLDAVDTPSAYDVFGQSVAISGDTTVIGAYGDDTPAGPSAGSAYVFAKTDGVWSQQGRLVATDGMPADAFGYSVAIDGDTVAVGAYQDDAVATWNAGSVYVFTRDINNLWNQQQKIEPDVPIALGNFGFQVDVSGDSLAVGTLADMAYVFTRSASTWSQQQTIQSDDLVAGDSFGSALAIEGDYLVVGANFDDTASGSDAGSAYVFLRSGGIWSQQQQLTASNGAVVDYFGSAIDLSNDTVVVGAYSHDHDSRLNSGSAYVFVRSGSTWSEQQILAAESPWSGDEFGASVAIAGNHVLIGSPKDDWVKRMPDDSIQLQNEAGSAHLYSRVDGVWSLQRMFVAPDGESGDFFGNAVALSENTALVGAYVDDGFVGVNEGSVHVFDIQRIELSSQTFSESIWPSQLIAYLTVGGNDEDWSFSLTSGDGADDNDLFSVPYGYNVLVSGSSGFDFEQQATLSIRVRAYKVGTTLEDTFILTLLDDRTEDADGDGLSEAEEEDSYGTSDLIWDDDGDGIPGGTEVSVGLNPAVDNSDLVNAIQSQPTEFGVDMDALSLGQPVLMRNHDTDSYTLILSLKKSTDLSQFDDMPMSAPEISVNADGDVEFNFSGDENTGFYRIEVE